MSDPKVRLSSALREALAAGVAAEARLNEARKIPADRTKRPDMDESYEPVAVLRAKELLWDNAPLLAAAVELAEAVNATYGPLSSLPLPTCLIQHLDDYRSAAGRAS